MLLNRKQASSSLKMTSYLAGEVQHDVLFKQKKLLVGSSDKCDIVLKDSHISFYHALLIIENDGGRIIDLESENGIEVNGKFTQQCHFYAGDTIKLGSIEFHILENMDKSCALEDQDAGKITKLDQKESSQIPKELPPLPGLVVIDGEYCDIVFNEDDYVPSSHEELSNHDIASNDFIDTHASVENRPILTKEKSESVKVTVLSRGHILSVDFLPLKNRTIFASSTQKKRNTILVNCLASDDNLPLVSIKDGTIKLAAIPGFDTFNLSTSEEINLNGEKSLELKKDEKISYNYKTVQIIVEVANTPPRISKTPFFGREREFHKHTAKVFSVFIAVMFLLLLVDTTVEPPKKQIAVIYRKAEKGPTSSNEKKSEVTAKKDKETGIKKENQKIAPPKMAKKQKSLNKLRVNKKTAQKKATKKSNTKKSATVKKIAKTKAYKFKLKSNLKSLVGNTKPTKSVSFNTSATNFGTKSAVNINNVDTTGTKSARSQNIATLGKDFKGQFDSSTGTRGLAAKSGIDTTYVAPKTVVLGSMDPELLRKILQEYLPQFRHCYQRELENNNENVKGVIDLNFRISKSGKVSKVGIKAKKSRFSKKGVNCMANVLHLIQFPKPKGGGVVDVRQPLNFFSEKNRI